MALYVLEDKLADAAFEDKMVRFVRASMKGWKYAEANPDEAAEISFWKTMHPVPKPKSTSVA